MKFYTFAAALAFALAASPAFAKTFGGYDCDDDCSGHKAGYEWAEENGVADESQCDGDTESFNEGCRLYVEDPNRGADDDDDGNEIED